MGSRHRRQAHRPAPDRRPGPQRSFPLPDHRVLRLPRVGHGEFAASRDPGLGREVRRLDGGGEFRRPRRPRGPFLTRRRFTLSDAHAR